MDSFGILYQRYFSTVVAIGYAMLGRREVAEDLAQEVFAIACLDLDKLNQPQRFPAWLAGICRNQARHLLRTQGRSDSQPLTFDIEAGENQSTHDLDLLRAALTELSPTERELITMRYYDQLSYRHMGLVLNCSVRAVNSRLIRTKDKIARYFKRYRAMGDNHEI